VPAHIRSDNGPEFVAIALRDWIAAVGAKTAYIEPASPWENGYFESFNGKLSQRPQIDARNMVFFASSSDDSTAFSHVGILKSAARFGEANDVDAGKSIGFGARCRTWK
jgi:transposase InsO family protein